MTGSLPIIDLIGIATAAFIIVLTVEFIPTLPKGKASSFLQNSDKLAAKPLPAWRGWLSMLDRPAARWTPQWLLQRVKGDLYFANLAGKWQGWNEIQFISLRIAGALGAFVMGLVLYDNFIPALIAALLGWQAPAMLLGGIAKRTRRRFQAQLPEFIQLVSAQMAAGVSLEEALKRASQTESLAARWMRYVIQMSQGRVLIHQMQVEAAASLMPDLIGMAVQLDFIGPGTSQQELMSQIAQRITDDFVSGAEQRAEKVGVELVIPMVLFYFLPFIALILALIGWPIVNGL